jgi:hypothetical protein
VLGSLGLAICDRDGYAPAGALIRESLRIFAELGDLDGVALQLEGLAFVAVWTAQPLRAARLFGAAESMWNRIGVPIPEMILLRHEAAVTRLRTELNEEMFNTFWEDGRSLAPDEAVSEILASSTSDVESPDGSRISIAG